MTKKINSFLMIGALALSGSCRFGETIHKKAEINVDSIIGGIQIDPSKTDTNYIVSIGGDCAGNIIASKWILTAAHCEDNFELPITAGSYDLKDPSRITLNVKKYYIHPKHGYHNYGENYDFALIELENEIDFDHTKLHPIKLANPDFEMQGLQKIGTMATVIGWGKTETDIYPTKLRMVNVPIVSNEKANAEDSYDGIIDESMIVAGFDEGGKDTCTSDSGGPLLINDPSTNEDILVGVTSFGFGCAQPKHYGVYAKVSYAYDWIIKTIHNSLKNKEL